MLYIIILIIFFIFVYIFALSLFKVSAQRERQFLLFHSKEFARCTSCKNIYNIKRKIIVKYYYNKEFIRVTYHCPDCGNIVYV